MSLTDNEKRALEKLVAKAKEQFAVRKVILFGSKARNDFREDSDVDLLILVDNQVDRHLRWKLTDIATEIEWETDTYFSCKMYNYSDWENENEEAIFLPFKDNVTRDGELIEI